MDEEHPGHQGIPDSQGYNGEEQEPAEPTRRKPSEEDGDDDAQGESGEGSQSTGDPNSAG